ncbi:MAG: prepilin-type N-terminal cleavage/methylation domain-containing protein [Anaerolineae bacterium]|nr:prepilin-type N-terminal cleavage/methylation domain-containing protein [Anaerolineae bacterium]
MRCPPIWPKREEGFTFVESMLATAIGAILISTVVVLLFQFNSLTRLQQDSMVLNHQLQDMATALGNDITSAITGTVENEAQSKTLSLQIPTYTFGQATDPVTRTVVYTYSEPQKTLLRTEGSNSMTIARYISSLDFGPSGPVGEKVCITVTVSLRGQSRSTAFEFYRRPSE